MPVLAFQEGIAGDAIAVAPPTPIGGELDAVGSGGDLKSRGEVAWVQLTLQPRRGLDGG